MSGPCAKQRVFAYARVNGVLHEGENWVRNPQKVCPRGNLPTGEGYELCASVCDQQGHAEVDLIRKAGGDLRRAPVVVVGHTYACETCRSALAEANAGEILFVPARNGER